MKLPKTIGASIDLLFALREKRKKINREADKIKAEEKLIEDHLINSFDKGDLEGARGKLAQCSIERQVVGSIKDIDELWPFVRKKNLYEIFQRRLNNKVLSEYWDAGKEVPGVEKYTVLKLHLTKK